MYRVAFISFVIIAAAVSTAFAQAPKKANAQQLAEAAKALNQFGCKLHVDEKAAGSPVDLIWFPPKTNDNELARLIGHASRFPQLKAVDLGETRITDAGLKELCKLSNLESVYLDETSITDKGLPVLDKIERLAWLDLSNTKVTVKCVDTLVQFKALTHLFLNKIDLSKQDVERIVTLNKLQSLGVKSLPDEMVPQLAKLEIKDLRLGRLGTKGVADLEKLSKLESLRLQGGLAYIDAGGWKSLSELKALRTLELGNFAPDDWTAYGRWITGKNDRKNKTFVLAKSTPGLANLQGLKKLDLTGIPLGNDALDHVCKIASLEELSVCCTAMTFEDASALSGLGKLQMLNVRNCFVTNKGLKSLEALKELRVLYLYDNPISETGVKQLQKALPRCTIWWKYTSGGGSHNFRVPGGYGG